MSPRMNRIPARIWISFDDDSDDACCFLDWFGSGVKCLRRDAWSVHTRRDLVGAMCDWAEMRLWLGSLLSVGVGISNRENGGR
jgi:hypothetical protein